MIERLWWAPAIQPGSTHHSKEYPKPAHSRDTKDTFPSRVMTALPLKGTVLLCSRVSVVFLVLTNSQSVLVLAQGGAGKGGT